MPDSDRRNSLLITDNRTGEPCYSPLENGTVSKMEFRPIRNPGEQISGSSPDEEQALLQQLDRFSGALVAELLDAGTVAVDGLGMFSIVHEHAAREMTESGSRFLPPRKRVVFDPIPGGKGDSARIAAERLDMKADDALQLTKALSGLFERSRKKSLDLKLRGFGSFSKVEGLYVFQPDPSVVELLNSAYDGLKTIDIQDSKDIQERKAAPVPGAGSGGQFKKAAAVVTASVLLAAGGYLVSRQISPDSIIALTGSKTPTPATKTLVTPSTTDKVPDQVSVIAVPARNAGSAVPDSVVLAKGRFTVVTATFSSMKTVRQEIGRLSGLGHRIMVWPVKAAGKQSYRLVTGDFESHRAALDSVKTLPQSLSKNIYIQQASKNVVLYGEKGL
ncbi:MAG TPA: SPOR domain-containing protein [Chlorobaculum sp.]|nr:SPOR domain-containing protein [Chlorobaculum sp.]